MVKKKHYTSEELLALARTLNTSNYSSADSAILRKLQLILESSTERPKLSQWQLDVIRSCVCSMMTCRPKTIGVGQIRAVEVLGELGDERTKVFLEERLRNEQHDGLSNAIRKALEKIKQKGEENGTSK